MIHYRFSRSSPVRVVSVDHLVTIVAISIIVNIAGHDGQVVLVTGAGHVCHYQHQVGVGDQRHCEWSERKKKLAEIIIILLL